MAISLNFLLALVTSVSSASLPENQVGSSSIHTRKSLRRLPSQDTDVALFVHHTSAKIHSSKSDAKEASFSAWDTAPPAKNEKFEEMAEACNADMEWLQPGEYDSLTFRCLGGLCLPIQGRCNGFYNCGDGSDETNCPSRRATKDFQEMSKDCTGFQLSIEPGSHDEVTFRCMAGSCVPMEVRCNGFANCGDASDEMECHNRSHAKDSRTVSHGGDHMVGHKHARAHKGNNRTHRFISRSSVNSANLFSDLGDEEPQESAASTAELSEAGYQAVVALGDTDEMRVFAQRVVAKEGLEILDEGSFSGMLPYYSGECKVQSYEDLVEEVHAATMANKCHGQWTRIAPPPPLLPVPDQNGTDVPPEQAPAPVEKSAHNTAGPIDGVNLVSEVQHMASASQERAFAWRAAQRDVVGYVQQTFSADGLPHIGESASLDNHGYNQVRAEHSSLEMSLFIRRVLKKHRLVADETGLQYCVPWYSGECESKSYGFLVTEIHEGITRPAHCGGPWVERVPKTAGQK